MKLLHQTTSKATGRVSWRIASVSCASALPFGDVGNGVATAIGLALGALVDLVLFFHHDEMRRYPANLRTLRRELGALPQRLKKAIAGEQLTEYQLRTRRVVIPVIAGVSLVAVPTVFTVFPSFTGWSVLTRSLLLAAWVVVALTAALLTNQTDEKAPSGNSGRPGIRRRCRAPSHNPRQDHRNAASRCLRHSRGYHLTIYAPTADGAFLIPIFPAVISTTDPAIFPVGAGAVGRAWGKPDLAGVMVMTGPAVYGSDLTGIQQEHYSMFGMVAAVLIRDSEGTPIGAITAIGRQAEDDFFETEDGVLAMKSLAKSVAWIIPEGVRWMWPRPEGGD